ncbi:unnamed protein product [Eruca vesicaria subsp. sativa]|uniref:Uncharacterized protein n=1 Tax=Eruca vesicaria subsp. sativa TaxID=29727 RepID=A0ABC8LSM5_ERUVS|nr:unnamed protein product [Eruca vesicaria subsp. sativa]
MERAKRTPLSARNKHKKRTGKRLIRSIVTYLKSDAYLFAPLLFSNSSDPPFSPQIQMPPPSESSKGDDLPVAGLEALGMEKVKQNKTRLSEKVKEYLKSDYHMYRPMISVPKLGSSLRGKLQITNSVTMEVSKSIATMREDNNSYRYQLRSESDSAQHTLPNRRISSPNRHRTGDTNISPPFSPLQERKISEATSKDKESFN